jgi:exodeoxyribonuclease VII large subunit
VKRRLEQEGLFDAARKKPLPAFPRCVGIVTSPSGAVIRDFITVISRRHAALEILLYPALVQGEAAAAEVAKGIAYFNQSREVDLIVIARGGGSLEDLAPFNTESLARAIAASELPVVSAVGHETDFTIADFAADLRAPTPSAAAELITAAQHKVEEHVEELSHRLSRAVRYAVMQARERFSRVSIETALARIQDDFGRRQQRVDELGFRMESAWRVLFHDQKQRLESLATAVSRNDAAQRIRLFRERLENFSSRLFRAHTLANQNRRAALQSLERQLTALSPLAVLNRGYALVYNESGALLKSASGARPGELLFTRLASGAVESRITKITPENAGPEKA